MSAGGTVAVRRATAADAMDVLAWRNDPLTRAMSRDTGEVGEAAHRAWFATALADPRRTLLIGEADGAKVGMVRFDRGPDPEGETEVSINLAPGQRGRGLSRPLLLAALAEVDGEVWAEVREANLASVRLFEGAGFELQGRRDGVRRYRRPG
ncbi:GNAT family N-acetyltransferase [Phenylobacterium sp.]|uniref:GNAT family N-acetyltransferase n=1 Tax=Phenylobacterium sp. TaxID=1871053 RepID=UPI00301D1265